MCVLVACCVCTTCTYYTNTLTLVLFFEHRILKRRQTKTWVISKSQITYQPTRQVTGQVHRQVEHHLNIAPVSTVARAQASHQLRPAINWLPRNSNGTVCCEYEMSMYCFVYKLLDNWLIHHAEGKFLVEVESTTCRVFVLLMVWRCYMPCLE